VIETFKNEHFMKNTVIFRFFSGIKAGVAGSPHPERMAEDPRRLSAATLSLGMRAPQQRGFSSLPTSGLPLIVCAGN
jgi:hypothetical protein